MSGEYDGSEQSEEEDVVEQNMPTRPQRLRRPPQVLTYNSLGNPQHQCVEPVVRSTFFKVLLRRKSKGFFSRLFHPKLKFRPQSLEKNVRLL